MYVAAENLKEVLSSLVAASVFIFFKGRCCVFCNSYGSIIVFHGILSGAFSSGVAIYSTVPRKLCSIL